MKMSSSAYQRILVVLERAERPLKASEIASRDPRLGWRQVGLTIHHSGKPSEIKIVEQGGVRRYRLVREGT